MTKLGVFDKFEEAKKYTGLSENDKMGNFWQYWKSGKLYGPLTLWAKLSVFDKIEEVKKYTGLSENIEKGGVKVDSRTSSRVG